MDLREITEARRLDPAAARALRIAAGVGLREMASAIGVVPSTLSRWERGLRRPRSAAAVRWAEAVRNIAGAFRG